MTTILQRENRMPSLAGATEWLGSEPLTPADLQGNFASPGGLAYVFTFG